MNANARAATAYGLSLLVDGIAKDTAEIGAEAARERAVNDLATTPPLALARLLTVAVEQLAEAKRGDA
jgi:hypothetical protein